MAIENVIDAMTTGEKMGVNGYSVEATEMKNGKRKFLVTRPAILDYNPQELCNEPRTGKQVLSLIAFDKKRCRLVI